MQAELRSGRFRFGLQERVTRKSGEEIGLWSARDALVLKALAGVLGDLLPISRRCVHVKGHGGAKAAVRQVVRQLPSARFVLKTDVASYYASIDHVKLLDLLSEVIPDRDVLNLVGQMCGRVAERGGLYFGFRRGIPLGCPLSPLLGAFFLNQLDDRLEATGLFRFFLEPAMHDAEAALALGLVGEVVDANGFDQAFIAYCEKNAEIAPLAATQTKRLVSRISLLDNLETHLRDELTYAARGLMSEDGREARRAMCEKRKPVFGGR